MTQYNYASGFLAPISAAPVARNARENGKPPKIHARMLDDFTLGVFSRAAGQLLCGAPEEIPCLPVSLPLDSVSCVLCRTQLDRWSRDALLSKCKGFALNRDGHTRAVAAKSTAMASEILGIGDGMMVRCGINQIVLGAQVDDGYDHIRKALKSFDYGSVIRMDDGDTVWTLEQSSERAEEILRQHLVSFSVRGNTRVVKSALQRNRSIRLTPFEVEALRDLGGAAWVRARIDLAKKSHIENGMETPSVNVTIRTTEAQWEKVRAMGGYTWIRSMIHRALKSKVEQKGV